MPTPVRKLSFQNCEVWFWNDDYLETVFPDGKKCPALFDYGDESRRLARALGYTDTVQGVRQMHIDHELAHTFLAEREGKPYSPVLRGVAAPDERPSQIERLSEEHRVLEFQKRLHGRDDDRDQFRERFACL